MLSYDQFLVGRRPVHGIQFIGLLVLGTLLSGTGVAGFALALLKVWSWRFAPFYALLALAFYYPVIYLGWLHLRRAFANRRIK